MTHRRRLPLVLSLLLAACGDPAGPVDESLVGTWRTVRFEHLPQGWYRTTLTLAANGEATVRSERHGVYPGQARDDLSAYEQSTGTWSVRRDTLFLTARRAVWWDRFHGANFPEQVHAPTPGSPFSGARYTRVGDRLVLHYLSYPADAPVATTMSFTRE